MTPIYDPNNIFAKILRGEAPCVKVYEDEVSLAFMAVSYTHLTLPTILRV